MTADVVALPVDPATDPDDGLLRSLEVCARAGCTYRQLDFWTRCGYVKAARPGKGHGTRRGYDDAEIAIIRRMAALVHVGLAPKTAAYAARNGYETWLSGDVKVSIREEP